jgi:maleate isomerase
MTADIQECTPQVSYSRARAVDSDRAEAVFISCTGFRAIEHLDMLEADLGKPVFSSNQATFADCLNMLGVSEVVPGFSHLFGRMLGVRSD